MQNRSYKLDTSRLLGLRLLQQIPGNPCVFTEKFIAAKVGINGKDNNFNNQQE